MRGARTRFSAGAARAIILLACSGDCLQRAAQVPHRTDQERRLGQPGEADYLLRARDDELSRTEADHQPEVPGAHKVEQERQNVIAGDIAVQLERHAAKGPTARQAGRVEPQAARVSAHDLEAIVAGGLHVDEVGRLRQHALHPLTVAIGEMPLGIMADQDEMTVHVLSLPHF